MSAQIKDSSIETFLDELASQNATPGGGSAAAIMGAKGAALVSMVCNLTIGKKKYADVEADMKDVLAKSEALRKKLTGMIEDDVRAFGTVMGAYGMPKETDEREGSPRRGDPESPESRDRGAARLLPCGPRSDRSCGYCRRKGKPWGDFGCRRRRAGRFCCTAKCRLKCFHQRENDQ